MPAPPISPHPSLGESPGQSPGGGQGPRPLPLHLALQTMTWLSSLAALNGLKDGSLPWNPGLKKAAEALQKNLEKSDTGDFAAAVDAEARRRLAVFAEGVSLYRDFPRPPRPTVPAAAWRAGSTELLDYGSVAGTTGANRASVLVVPSLINRGYILDLTEKRSFMRHLASAGLHPYLIEWGTPGPDEHDFTLTDYICRRLEPALDEICRFTGRAPGVVGYCMGGNLALALAVRKPVQVAALALLATPWDFHAGMNGPVRMLKAMAPGLNLMINQLGELPIDVIQALFASLTPYSTATKFNRFAGLDPTSNKAQNFVALEDWLNDGVPLTGPVARECLDGWYGDNTPVLGKWRVSGSPVRGEEVRSPTLLVIPQQDHIVPPGSATALAETIPGALTKNIAAGHIGMMTGSRAKAGLYQPLTKWLQQTLT